MKPSSLHDEHVRYALSFHWPHASAIKPSQSPSGSHLGSVILICCLFSNSSFVFGLLGIKFSCSQAARGCVVVGSYLVEWGNGSRGVAAEAVASLDCADCALEAGAVQQLGELQEAVAQDKQLGHTDRQAWVSETGYCHNAKCLLCRFQQQETLSCIRTEADQSQRLKRVPLQMPRSVQETEESHCPPIATRRSTRGSCFYLFLYSVQPMEESILKNQKRNIICAVRKVEQMLHQKNTQHNL